jgi:TrmH family RNA methyltransferase
MASLPAAASVLSSKSGRVRAARRLVRRSHRDELGLFLAEGPQAVREALATPGAVSEVFAVPGSHAELQAVASVAGVTWTLVDEAALASLADTVHPQGVVAVCGALDVPLSAVLQSSPRLLAMCVDIRDPGNAGTVTRSADAAGADGVVFLGQSVDPYNGKAVRATVGSLFHLPIVRDPDVAGSVAAVRQAGITLLAADGAGELDIDRAAAAGLLAGPTAWLFGNEAWGLDEQTAALADHRVRVTLYGRAESLNLATAAALCLYASAREHRR